MKLTLGEKIKQRRRELHLTQAALAGDSITRILISRIESGDVNPSLETLKYLSDRLGLPVGYLLSDEDDLLQFLLPRIKDELRSKYISGDDAGIFALCEKYGLHDAESSMILCECAVRLGRQAYERGAGAEADEWFDRALSYAEETPYHTEFVLGEAMLCKAMLAEMNDEKASVYLESYADTLGRAVDLDRYLLLRFFSDLKVNGSDSARPWHEAIPMRNPLYGALRRIWLREADGDVDGAKAALAELMHGETEKELERDPLLLYRCIAKMEHLSAMTEDYKSAYQYAGKRAQLERRYGISGEHDEITAKKDDGSDLPSERKDK